MMVSVCGLLGEAAFKAGENIETLGSILEWSWRDSYMRGYERARRRALAERLRREANGKQNKTR